MATKTKKTVKPKVAKKRPPTKKAPAVTFSAKKAPSKRPAKKATSASAAKTSTAKKKPTSQRTKGKGGQYLPRDLNEHGFVKGSDSEKIVEVLLEGGADRAEINAKVLKALGKRKTRNGNEPNTSSLIANILRRLKDKGYHIESTWQLVPPTAEEAKTAARRAKRAAAKK
jgi:hypothetical protein